MSTRPIEDAILLEAERLSGVRLGLDDYRVVLHPLHHQALIYELFPGDATTVIDYMDTEIGMIYLDIDDNQLDGFTMTVLPCDTDAG